MTAIDLAKLRATTARLSFHDRVEALYYKLIPNERFRSLMDTVAAYGSVEGSVLADEYAAARMIREAAKAEKDDIVASALPEKVKTKTGEEADGARGDHKVALSLRVVAKRHQMSRAMRLAAAKAALRLEARPTGESASEH
jgi:hypothetical protein